MNLKRRDLRVTPFLYKENHTLDAWFRKAYGSEGKSLFKIISAVHQLHKIIKTGRRSYEPIQPAFYVMCPIRSIEPDSRWGNKQRREYVLDAPDKPSGKRVQHIHIKYDGLGFISLNELMKKETA